jgi:hypothetical protein
MERTASNLVRIVLIVIVSLVVIFAGLLLAVYAAFYGTINPSAHGSHLKEAAGVLAFLLAGIFVITMLAKGIQRVPLAPQDLAAIPATPARHPASCTLAHRRLPYSSRTMQRHFLSRFRNKIADIFPTLKMRGKLAAIETGYERCGRHPVPLFRGRLRG